MITNQTNSQGSITFNRDNDSSIDQELVANLGLLSSSTTFEQYNCLCKKIATKLKEYAPDFSIVSLPSYLTPLHIAVLAQDKDLLAMAFDKCDRFQKTTLMMHKNIEDTAEDLALRYGWDEGVLALITHDFTNLEHSAESTHEKTSGFAGYSTLPDKELVLACSGPCSLDTIKHYYQIRYNENYAFTTQYHPSLQTVLHSNVRSGNRDVFNWLIDKGCMACIEIKDRNGETPYDILKGRLTQMNTDCHNMPEGDKKCELKNEIKEWGKLVEQIKPTGNPDDEPNMCTVRISHA